MMGILLGVLTLTLGFCGFLYNSISNLRSEFEVKVARIEDTSNTRDSEIKELIRELKQDMRDDMRELKEQLIRYESYKCAGREGATNG